MSVVVLGNMNVDVVLVVDRLPGADEEALALEALELPGGSALNTAIALSRLGARVRFVGCVGRDGYGDMLLRKAREEGVDTGLVRRSDRPTGRVIVMVERDTGRRSMVALRGANEEVANYPLRPEDLEGADILHVSGARLEVVKGAFAVARARGVKTSYDPGSVAVRGDMERLREVLKEVDVLFLNTAEAAELANRGLTLERLRDMVSMVVVKRGELGAEAYSGGVSVFRRAFRVNVVDTTGAGDAFAAGFLWALLNGLDLGSALVMANATAAIKISRVGAQSSPRRHELADFLRERGYADLSQKLLRN